MGKFDSKYRHNIFSLAMQSYSQVTANYCNYHYFLKLIRFLEFSLTFSFLLLFEICAKIGAFPHEYHIDGSPCQTHVR